MKKETFEVTLLKLQVQLARWGCIALVLKIALVLLAPHGVQWV